VTLDDDEGTFSSCDPLVSLALPHSKSERSKTSIQRIRDQMVPQVESLLRDDSRNASLLQDFVECRDHGKTFDVRKLMHNAQIILISLFYLF